MIQSVDGKLFKDMVYKAANLLEKNKETLNALNVFPVPDGDTGTNMSLTMISAAKEVAAADENDRKALLEALSLGALKGARGNSGVILSQIFAGFSNAIIKSELEFGTPLMANAFRSGVELAYKAVMKPKEGTILTVAKSMADAAELMAGKTTDVRKQMSYVIQQAEETLKKTPDMLPVLKEAGVVDAGGAGLITIMMGFKAVLYGEADAGEGVISEETLVDFSDFKEPGGTLEFCYCTEFFIKNIAPEIKDRDIDSYRNALMNIGDCVLVVGNTDLVKTHVHTNEPDKALRMALALGELSQIKIDNMTEQHRELHGEEMVDMQKKNLAVVAVNTGEGIKNIFSDWQVGFFVEGGQSMNPSTEDILKVIEQADSDNVIVLPNNKNIILAANQAAEMSDKNVVVINTKTVPQGIAAAVAYDPDADIEANARNMMRAIADVKTGLITNAVRDSKMNGNSIKKDEVIGIYDDDIVANGSDIKMVAQNLLYDMTDEESELITVYYGEGTKEEDAKELISDIEKKFSACDVELLLGGQPVYQYMISVE